MKKVFGMLFAAALLAGTLNAQPPAGPQGKKGPGKHAQGAIAKDLNLSPEQQAKMKKLNEAFRADMKKLMDNESITVKQQRDQRTELMKKHRSQMESILTPEQKKDLQTKRAAVKARATTMQAKGLDKMKEKLNLSPDQVTAIKANQQKNREKVEAIVKNDKLSRDQKKAQMESLRTEHKNAMEGILSKDQLKQWEEIRKNMPKPGMRRGGKGPGHFRHGMPGGPVDPPEAQS